MINSKNTMSVLLVGMLFPALALAHSETAGIGFVSGLLHPIFGYDHLLAMLSVGIVSAQLGGRAIWTVPVLFVLSMIGGGAIGVMDIPVPYVEQGVALSVIVLGVGIVFAQKQRSLILIMLFVSFFGILHGHAHGVEMPRSASPVYYSFGFVTSTSLIHLLGVLIGYTLTQHSAWRKTLTYLGGAVSLTGCFLFFSLLRV